MGWKLAGLALSTNFDCKIPNLANLIGVKLTSTGLSSTFEDQTLQILDDDEIAFGFFGTGTLVFTGTAVMSNDDLLSAASKLSNILAFYINDTTSTYCLDYFQNGQHTICHWISYSDANITGVDNFGLLPPGIVDPDALQTIFNFISEIIGRDFYDIDESESMVYMKMAL